MKNHTWKTKDGRSFPIKEMDTDHIKSCIKFLERQNVYDTDDYCPLPINLIISSKNDWIRIFQQELARRVKEDEYE